MSNVSIPLTLQALWLQNQLLFKKKILITHQRVHRILLALAMRLPVSA